MTRVGEVLDYWLDEVGPKGWYAGGEELDADIARRFRPLWDEAMAGRLSQWLCAPADMLAFLIVTDQFPRNMFRGTAAAYSSDRLARSAAQAALDRGYDLRTPEPQRQFFYMPFEHSESQSDQDRSVRLMKTRMSDPELLLHARAHRAIIRRFGRFPYRNAHLGRRTTAAEQEFLEAGGYGAAVRELRPA